MTLEAARERLEAILGHGEADVSGVTFTVRSKKVLDLALGAARRLGDDRVDTEHLLLALASEPEGVAAQILAGLGVGQRELRAEVMSLTGREDSPESSRKGSAMRIVPEPSGYPATTNWTRISPCLPRAINDR